MSNSALNAGNGGETHQVTDADHPVLTTNHGTPISDNQNQLKAGARGPVLIEDEVFREKMNHFDHERIPERIELPPSEWSIDYYSLDQGR
uniref:catalase n=1 Tax=uncultured Sphingomonas sp. TaxID=158754 RepID=UPI00262E25F1